MWRFLLGLVAIVTAIILIGISVAGGHGMFKNEWLQFGASVGVGIIDVAEIAFLLAMIAMAFEGSWGRAALSKGQAFRSGCVNGCRLCK